MASEVEQWFANVRDTYEAYLPVASQGVINWLYGAEYLYANANWPRIVCVPPRATWGPISGAGPRIGSGLLEDRGRYNRRVSIEWHVWFDTEENAEATVANLAVIGREQSGASIDSYAPESEEWPGQTPDGQVANGGSYAILTVALVYRISDQFIAQTIVAPTTTTHVGTFGPDEEEVC